MKAICIFNYDLNTCIHGNVQFQCAYKCNHNNTKYIVTFQFVVSKNWKKFLKLHFKNWFNLHYKNMFFHIFPILLWNLKKMYDTNQETSLMTTRPIIKLNLSILALNYINYHIITSHPPTSKMVDFALIQHGSLFPSTS